MSTPRRPRRKSSKLKGLIEPPSVLLRTANPYAAAWFLGHSSPYEEPEVPADSPMPPWTRNLGGGESVLVTGPDALFAFPVRDRADAANLQVEHGPFALYAICRTATTSEELTRLARGVNYAQATAGGLATLELEVLYVGRATGGAVTRSALDRLDGGHTKYQEVLEDHQGDPRQLILVVGSGLTCQLLTMTDNDLLAPNPRADLDRATRIALNEALVINHFQPQYNDQLVGTDLTATSVFGQLRDLKIGSVALPLGFDEDPVALWSPASPAATIHWMLVSTGL